MWVPTAVVIALILAVVAILPAAPNATILGYGGTDVVVALLITAFLGVTARI